jgi:hypothetical protein
VSPGSAIFWSALFTFDDRSNGNRLANVTFLDDNGDSIAFGEPAVGISALSVSANTAATTQLVSHAVGGAFTGGQTLLLVGRYQNSAAPDGDTLDLIVYDTADADTLPTSFDPTDPNRELALQVAGLDIDFAKIASIEFTIRGDDNNFIDELRIGTTYASVTGVVVEPGAVSMLLLGFGGIASARRRRR